MSRNLSQAEKNYKIWLVLSNASVNWATIRAKKI